MAKRAAKGKHQPNDSKMMTAEGWWRAKEAETGKKVVKPKVVEAK